MLNVDLNSPTNRIGDQNLTLDMRERATPKHMHTHIPVQSQKYGRTRVGAAATGAAAPTTVAGAVPGRDKE